MITPSNLFSPLASLLAESAPRTYMEFARLQSLTEWWQWLLVLALCGGVIAYVVALYRRDAVELRRGVGLLLGLLRLAAFAGLLIVFLDLEKRSERELVKNSRVAVLVDTSQSMARTDSVATATGDRTRIGQVIRQFEDGKALERFRKDHDVTVYAFGDDAQPKEVASYQRIASEESTNYEATTDSDTGVKTLMYASGGFFLLAILSVGLQWFEDRNSKQREEYTSWGFLVSVVSIVIAVVLIAVANLRSPNLDLMAALGLRKTTINTVTDTATEDAAEDIEVDWTTALVPNAETTRIGDAVRSIVAQQRGGPIAGVVVFSDGGWNSGVPIRLAAAEAADAKIQVHAVGLGTDKSPANIVLTDIEVPERVHPGDRFTIKGFVQAFGLEGRTVKVELFSSDASSEESGVERFEEDKRLTLLQDGETAAVQFQMSLEENQHRQIRLQVATVAGESITDDNSRTANVSVVERKSRVLLLAGGPTREFRFLRNLLYRDENVTSAVLLQSAGPGLSQEADELLFEFPKTEDELYSYDAIVAFDPDWLALDELQIKMLERWVSEKAGGLIVVAGPVFTSQWANRRQEDPRIDILRTLYPVELYSPRSASLTLGRFGGKEAWPLSFTRDGIDSEFLWLEDDAIGSEQAWTSFNGVYGYYAVKNPKQGAKVFAYFSDPQTKIDDQLPIYLAGHFYGAGRVFFQASGEMWRIREVDDTYFEQYYVKLVRWVSQGRLLRDSQRGVLLVDKNKCGLGEHVTVTAILSDQQHRPLEADDVLAVITKDGRQAPLKLERLKDVTRPGRFVGKFTVAEVGQYEVQLTPPGDDQELLTQEVMVELRGKEIAQPQRNDKTLRELTETTGGRYYVGMRSAFGSNPAAPSPLVGLFSRNDQVSVVTGAPDMDFERTLHGWLMILICGVLSLEWLIRRLNRLA